MITQRLLKNSKTISTVLKQNYGVSAILLQKASDPIQQLFVEKVREYAQKKKSSGGKLVDATADLERQQKQELDKVAKQYGGGPNIDMTQFPTPKFEEPQVDPQL